MTCLLPPGSLIVESSEALTPGPAVGLPPTLSAGHTLEHPLTFTHVSLLRESLVNAYSVKPEPFTKIFPRLVLRSWTVAALEARAAGVPPCALATAAALATPASTPLKSM